jgi:hypothetical protein
MKIGVDVDQTISTGYVGNSFQESLAYYQAKAIAVPEHIEGYPQLFQLPDVLRVHEVLPGALAGVTTLARYGSISYFTVRKHQDAQVEREIQAITQNWLREHHFPCPDEVVFCRSIMQKLIRLYEREKESTDSLLLIDDRWSVALQALEQITQNADYRHIATMLCKRLTLVAFGASSLPENPTRLRVIALPDWSCLVDLLAFLEQ